MIRGHFFAAVMRMKISRNGNSDGGKVVKEVI